MLTGKYPWLQMNSKRFFNGQPWSTVIIPRLFKNPEVKNPGLSKVLASLEGLSAEG
ncbi:MAG TPA: hypothetical protein GXX51_09340 [Firmicutes bacterium]|nr:hypothetical protein [Bacillota bacterium]